MAHHTEEHAVYTDRSLDDIGSVAFTQFRIEIFNLLTAELSMLREVEVGARVNTFHFFESKRHLKLYVTCCVSIVSELLVVVETIVFCAKTESLVPSHARFLPLAEPFEFGAWLHEELHLHLFKFAHTEDELASYDLITESLTDLCNTKRNLHATCLLHIEVVHEDTLCGLRTEVDGRCPLRSRPHFGLKHEVELAHFSPVASTANGANDFLVQDDLAQFFKVAIIESHRKTLVQSIALSSNFEHTTVGGAEFFFVEGFLETLATLSHFFLNLLVIFCELIFDKHVSAIAFLRILVVNQGIVKRIYVTRSLPNSGVHEDGRVDAHDVLVEQSHRLPPVLFDIIFEFNAELTVVIDCAQSVIDFTGGKYKSVLLAVGNYFLKNVFLCHVL